MLDGNEHIVFPSLVPKYKTDNIRYIGVTLEYLQKRKEKNGSVLILRYFQYGWLIIMLPNLESSL